MRRVHRRIERRDAQLKYLEALCDLDPDRYHMHHEAVCRLTAQRNPKSCCRDSSNHEVYTRALIRAEKRKKDIVDDDKKFFSGNLNDPNKAYCYVPDAYAHALARNSHVLEALDVIVTELGDISAANWSTPSRGVATRKNYFGKIIELAQKSDNEMVSTTSSSSSLLFYSNANLGEEENPRLYSTPS